MDFQLVIQFPISESTDFDQLLSLENLFQIVLGVDHLIDGHDFGSGEMTSRSRSCSHCPPKLLMNLSAFGWFNIRFISDVRFLRSLLLRAFSRRISSGADDHRK